MRFYMGDKAIIRKADRIFTDCVTTVDRSAIVLKPAPWKEIMPLSEQEICEQALRLPDAVKEHLAETLMASLSKKVDPAIERAHLDTVKRRLDELRSGRVAAVDGEAK